MNTFYDWFFSEPMPERQRIADYAGLSLAYLHKHTYVQQREPKFHFHNSVLLDRGSNGRLCLIDTTEGEIDWGYVLERLLMLRRAGRIGRGRIVPIPTAQFEAFWEAYPRKTGKHAAHKVWRDLGLDRQIGLILAHLKSLADTQEDDLQPHLNPLAERYLRSGAWKVMQEVPRG